MSLKNMKRDHGFTLIELLVVVVLLGILSGIAVFAVGNARDKAIAESCKSQQAQILKALDLYYIDNKGKWPDNTKTDGSAGFGANSASAVAGYTWSFNSLRGALVPTYLKEIPPYRGWGGSDANFVNLGTGDLTYNTTAVAQGRPLLADADVFFTAVIQKTAGSPAYVQMRNSLGATNCAYQPSS